MRKPKHGIHLPKDVRLVRRMKAQMLQDSKSELPTPLLYTAPVSAGHRAKSPDTTITSLCEHHQQLLTSPRQHTAPHRKKTFLFFYNFFSVMWIDPGSSQWPISLAHLNFYFILLRDFFFLQAEVHKPVYLVSLWPDLGEWKFRRGRGHAELVHHFILMLSTYKAPNQDI